MAQPTSKAISAADGRKVGQLAHPSQDLPATIEANFPKSSVVDETQISFSLVSVVRYKGSGHQVYVSVAKPSAAALSQNPGLGTQKIDLSNGETGWFTGRLNGATPNQIVIQCNGFLITVITDLDLERLKSLAADVIIS